MLLYQNGVFRINPFHSSAAQDGMTCRNAAFYRVWSLLTQTANQSFRGFIFTLAGDCQRVFTANLSASFPEQRTHKRQKFSCWTSHKSSQGGRLFCVFCWFGFFHLYWVWGASLKKLWIAPFRAKVFDRLCWALSGVLSWLSIPPSSQRVPQAAIPTTLLVWLWKFPCEVLSNLAPVPGI